jgi:hypothetical protein
MGKSSQPIQETQIRDTGFPKAYLPQHAQCGEQQEHPHWLPDDEANASSWIVPISRFRPINRGKVDASAKCYPGGGSSFAPIVEQCIR